MHCSFSLNIEHDFLVLCVEADVVGLGFSGVRICLNFSGGI